MMKIPSVLVSLVSVLSGYVLVGALPRELGYLSVQSNFVNTMHYVDRGAIAVWVLLLIVLAFLPAIARYRGRNER